MTGGRALQLAAFTVVLCGGDATRAPQNGERAMPAFFDRAAHADEPAGRSAIAPVFEAPDSPGAELGEKGKRANGVYLTPDRVVSEKVETLVDEIANKVKANAVILDIKDDSGQVTFTDEIPLARHSVRGYLQKMEKLLVALHERDIYVIGRLVCFKDQFFPIALPLAGVKEVGTGKLWRDEKGRVWIDPYSRRAHKYIAAVAVAAQKTGFDEIQLDYVRFPVDSRSEHAAFSNRWGGAKRYDAIAALLREVDSAISIPLSIDVFGLTANCDGDPNGLGQSIERLAPYIDAISPMLYLANLHDSVWRNATPETVRFRVARAVRGIRKRLPKEVVVRPLLQAFPFRAERLFGPEFIQDQIDASAQAGASGYLLWNPNGSYDAAIRSIE